MRNSNPLETHVSKAWSRTLNRMQAGLSASLRVQQIGQRWIVQMKASSVSSTVDCGSATCEMILAAASKPMRILEWMGSTLKARSPMPAMASKSLRAMLKGARLARKASAPATRAVHFFQPDVDGLEIRKVKLAFQVIKRKIVDQRAQAGQVQIGIETVFFPSNLHWLPERCG